jgi:hypothetical protein
MTARRTLTPLTRCAALTSLLAMACLSAPAMAATSLRGQWTGDPPRAPQPVLGIPIAPLAAGQASRGADTSLPPENRRYPAHSARFVIVPADTAAPRALTRT